MTESCNNPAKHELDRTVVSGTTLDAIGIIHNTDKSSKFHDYLNVYEEFLERYRHQDINMLEIGVLDGSSLRMWKEFFPYGRITAIDIQEKALRHSDAGIVVEIGDQGSELFLEDITKKYGPFDVIVEDGSHFWPHQILAMKCLVPALKPGGIFISEDLHVSFPPLADRYQRGAKHSAYEALCGLSEAVMRYRDSGVVSHSASELLHLAPLVSWVLFLRHASIIKRRR